MVSWDPYFTIALLTLIYFSALLPFIFVWWRRCSSYMTSTVLKLFGPSLLFLDVSQLVRFVLLLFEVNLNPPNALGNYIYVFSVMCLFFLFATLVFFWFENLLEVYEPDSLFPSLRPSFIYTNVTFDILIVSSAVVFNILPMEWKYVALAAQSLLIFLICMYFCIAFLVIWVRLRRTYLELTDAFQTAAVVRRWSRINTAMLVFCLVLGINGGIQMFQCVSQLLVKKMTFDGFPAPLWALIVYQVSEVSCMAIAVFLLYQAGKSPEGSLESYMTFDPQAAVHRPSSHCNNSSLVNATSD